MRKARSLCLPGLPLQLLMASSSSREGKSHPFLPDAQALQLLVQAGLSSLLFLLFDLFYTSQVSLSLKAFIKIP